MVAPTLFFLFSQVLKKHVDVIKFFEITCSLTGTKEFQIYNLVKTLERYTMFDGYLV